MARKKYEEEHENHERWLISYADFITLLFAFFVVMYAVSSVNEGKFRIMSEALGSAFGNAKAWPVQPTGGDTQIPPRKTAAAELEVPRSIPMTGMAIGLFDACNVAGRSRLEFDPPQYTFFAPA